MMMMGVLFLMGCARPSPEGTYVRHVQSEYSVGEDSLLVSSDGPHLLVERHTGFQRVKANGLSAKQLKVKRMVFDQSGAGWSNAKTGETIRFDENQLWFGAAVYQKK